MEGAANSWLKAESQEGAGTRSEVRGQSMAQVRGQSMTQGRGKEQRGVLPGSQLGQGGVHC